VSERRQYRSVLAVGTTVLVALACLFGGLLWVTRGGLPGPAKVLDVYFWNVGGRLGEGNSVRLAGVPIGTVVDVTPVRRPETMAPDPEHEGQETVVRVRCRIRRSVSVRDSYRVRVDGSNLVGDSFIDIVPTSEDGAQVADGGALIGESPLDLSSLFPAAERSLGEVGDAAHAFNTAVTEQDLTAELVGAARSIQEAMTEVAALARELTEITGENEDEVVAAVREVSRAARSLGEAGESIESLVGDSENKEALERTIHSAASASANLEKVASEMERLLVEDKGIERMDATLTAAQSAAEGLDSLASDLSRLTKGPLGEQALIAPLALVQQASKDLSRAANHVIEAVDAARAEANRSEAPAGREEGEIVLPKAAPGRDNL